MASGNSQSPNASRLEEDISTPSIEQRRRDLELSEAVRMLNTFWPIPGTDTSGRSSSRIQRTGAFSTFYVDPGPFKPSGEVGGLLGVDAISVFGPGGPRGPPGLSGAEGEDGERGVDGPPGPKGGIGEGVTCQEPHEIGDKGGPGQMWDIVLYTGLEGEDQICIPGNFISAELEGGANIVALGLNSKRGLFGQNQITIGDRANGGLNVDGWGLWPLPAPGNRTIAIGEECAVNGQLDDTLAIGVKAASSSFSDVINRQPQGVGAVAIGLNTGQGIYLTAGGNQAISGEANLLVDGNPFTGQQGSCLAIGAYAGRYGQAEGAVAVGDSAGARSEKTRRRQGSGAVAVGYSAARTGQQQGALAIGSGSGTSPSWFGDAVTGDLFTIVASQSAGSYCQQTSAVAVGKGAGQTVLDSGSAVPDTQFNALQPPESVAVGSYALKTSGEGLGSYTDALNETRYAGGRQTAIGAYAALGGQYGENASVVRKSGAAVALGYKAGSINADRAFSLAGLYEPGQEPRTVLVGAYSGSGLEAVSSASQDVVGIGARSGGAVGSANALNPRAVSIGYRSGGGWGASAQDSVHIGGSEFTSVRLTNKSVVVGCCLGTEVGAVSSMSGEENVRIGSFEGGASTSTQSAIGSFNVIVGTRAMDGVYGDREPTGNVVIGHSAGAAGDYNLVIGENADLRSAAGEATSNTVLIHAGGFATADTTSTLTSNAFYTSVLRDAGDVLEDEFPGINFLTREDGGALPRRRVTSLLTDLIVTDNLTVSSGARLLGGVRADNNASVYGDVVLPGEDYYLNVGPQVTWDRAICTGVPEEEDVCIQAGTITAWNVTLDTISTGTLSTGTLTIPFAHAEEALIEEHLSVSQGFRIENEATFASVPGGFSIDNLGLVEVSDETLTGSLHSSFVAGVGYQFSLTISQGNVIADILLCNTATAATIVTNKTIVTNNEQNAYFDIIDVDTARLVVNGEATLQDVFFSGTTGQSVDLDIWYGQFCYPAQLVTGAGLSPSLQTTITAYSITTGSIGANRINCDDLIEVGSLTPGTVDLDKLDCHTLTVTEGALFKGTIAIGPCTGGPALNVGGDVLVLGGSVTIGDSSTKLSNQTMTVTNEYDAAYATEYPWTNPDELTQSYIYSSSAGWPTGLTMAILPGSLRVGAHPDLQGVPELSALPEKTILPSTWVPWHDDETGEPDDKQLGKVVIENKLSVTYTAGSPWAGGTWIFDRPFRGFAADITETSWEANKGTVTASSVFIGNKLGFTNMRSDGIDVGGGKFNKVSGALTVRDSFSLQNPDPSKDPVIIAESLEIGKAQIDELTLGFPAPGQPVPGTLKLFQNGQIYSVYIEGNELKVESGNPPAGAVVSVADTPQRIENTQRYRNPATGVTGYFMQPADVTSSTNTGEPEMTFEIAVGLTNYKINFAACAAGGAGATAGPSLPYNDVPWWAPPWMSDWKQYNSYAGGSGGSGGSIIWQDLVLEANTTYQIKFKMLFRSTDYLEFPLLSLGEPTTTDSEVPFPGLLAPLSFTERSSPGNYDLPGSWEITITNVTGVDITEYTIQVSAGANATTVSNNSGSDIQAYGGAGGSVKVEKVENPGALPVTGRGYACGGGGGSGGGRRNNGTNSDSVGNVDDGSARGGSGGAADVADEMSIFITGLPGFPGADNTNTGGLAGDGGESGLKAAAAEGSIDPRIPPFAPASAGPDLPFYQLPGGGAGGNARIRGGAAGDVPSCGTGIGVGGISADGSSPDVTSLAEGIDCSYTVPLDLDVTPQPTTPWTFGGGGPGGSSLRSVSGSTGQNAGGGNGGEGFAMFWFS